MKAFTLTENPVVGVHVDYRFGATTKLFTKTMSPLLSEIIYGAIRDEVVALQGASFLRTTAVNEALDRAKLFLSGERSDVIPLTRFDIDGDQLIPERDQRDRRCLLHFRMAPGVGGHVVLTGNGTIEKIDNRGWVRRVSTPFPSLGIDVVAQDKGEYLLMLAPGATFRVQRSGALEGAAPTTIVHWDPSWGETFLHTKKELHDNPLAWGLKVYHREREKRSDIPG